MKLKSILFFYFVTLLLSTSCYAKNDFDESKISGKTNRIVKKISKVNFLMGSAVGASGMMPKQFENFLELKKNAKKDELITLTNHPNGVVRCYSFWALLETKNIDLFSIVKKHLNDDAIIETQFGCMGSNQKVGDFYIQLLTTHYEDEEENKNLLNEKQVKELDSLLIYSENNLDSKYLAIENAEPTELLYPKVRELVINFNNQSALVTLSKYKNPNDIDLILKSKDDDDDEKSGYFYTYKAIQNFPDSQFLPFLEKRLYETLDNDHFSNEWLGLYGAIAAFKNQKSLELLTIPFTKVQHQNIKKYHINFVYESILSHKSELYNDLLWKIWQNEHIITLEAFQYLLQLDKAKTLELSKKELHPNYNVNDTNSTPKTNKDMISENLQETMLNFILLNDKALSHTIINDKIKNANVHDFKIYSEKISELKDPNFIEVLFERLKTEDNPYVYIEAVETLITFNDDSINKRILDTRKKNKNMNKDWGSDSLNEILKKNNIK